jgi:coenzyme PQQ precursor peptide PqqA
MRDARHATCEVELVSAPTRPRRPPAGVVPTTRRPPMQWTRPAFEDLRFGFEITMYIASR